MRGFVSRRYSHEGYPTIVKRIPKEHDTPAQNKALVSYYGGQSYRERNLIGCLTTRVTPNVSLAVDCLTRLISTRLPRVGHNLRKVTC